MMTRSRFILTMLVALLLALVPAIALAQGNAPAGAQQGTSLAKGFNGPMGVTVGPDGNIWVVDSGTGGPNSMQMNNPETGEPATVTFGDTARVVRVSPNGQQTEVAKLPSLSLGWETSGPSRLAFVGSQLYATSGGWQDLPGQARLPNFAAVVSIDDGKVSEVANTWDLESSANPGGYAKDTHPYGLAAGPDGALYVADAGGNSLLRIDSASKRVSLVTAFAGLPAQVANPARDNKMEADPVPTGVVVKDGFAYVSFLPGGPLGPDSAKIVRVSLGAEPAVQDFATGLTSVTDLRAGPDGNLYAVQIGGFGDQGPTPNSGAVMRITPDGQTQQVLAGLAFPTSIDLAPNGDAYVLVNGLGAPGSGELVKFGGLAAPSASGQAPSTLPVTGGVLYTGAGIAALGLALAAAGAIFRARRPSPPGRT